QFRVRAVLLGRSDPQPTPGRGAADPRGRPRVGVSSPGATLRRGAGPAPLRTIALGTTHALPLHARPRLATARLAGVRSPRRPDSRGIPRPRCRDDARRVQRGGMGRRVRPGGIRRDRPRVRLRSAPPRRGRHVRFVRLDRGPAALARGGWEGVRGELARLPARRHRRRRGPDLRRVLRGLQIDQRRPGTLRPSSGFDETDLVFGSGARRRGGGVTFVSSGSTVDRLHSHEVAGRVCVANSLACLLVAIGADVDPTYAGYYADFKSISDGLVRYA